MTAAIRNFFLKQDFQDVITPPMVDNPGFEPHIHPFQIKSIYKNQTLPQFLHTSPEFHMKELLSYGLEKIFNISYCFRDEPTSPIHRQQFLMCEWYRSNVAYEKIMTDIEQLIPHCIEYFQSKKLEISQSITNQKVQRLTISEIFQKEMGFDILDFLEKNQIKDLMESKFPDIPLPEENCMSWDDYFFLLFLNKIEPQLKNYPLLILYEYPRHLSALSTIKKDDPRVCERFEFYISGIEVANCYSELTDLEEQKHRYQNSKSLKKELYRYDLPTPNILFDALERKIPVSSGIALGIERLLLGITGRKDIFYSSDRN
jgi:elongation factor P--(R)-beta-lysine ligase